MAGGRRYEEALECYDHALALRADIPQIWVNRGRALQNLVRLNEAEASLREALRLKPDFADAHHELGSVLYYLGRFEEAETSVRAALRLQPENALAHYRLGRIVYHLGRPDDAQASIRTALRLRPNIPEWHEGLCHALLLAGQFEEGWREFDWHWRSEPPDDRISASYRRGEAVGDRTILLFADHQGHGDTLQFCRYALQVAATARTTILAVQPALVRLLSRIPGVTVVTYGRELPSCDLRCALLRLPHVFGTMLDTVPASIPYLAADPIDVVRWRDRLAQLTGLRIGLCWAGEQGRDLGKIAWTRRRSITLDMLAPLASIRGAHFISLQKDRSPTKSLRPPEGMKLHDFMGDIHDFADTAALIENLDLVISVDTAVAHLAGAIGKPIWLLNRFDTCWRWLLDREDSPWYPTLRQFRQPTPGDWRSVINCARDALQKLVEGDDSQLRASPFAVPISGSLTQGGHRGSH